MRFVFDDDVDRVEVEVAARHRLLEVQAAVERIQRVVEVVSESVGDAGQTPGVVVAEG